MGKQIVMKDVAKLAGVSSQTVSRVLSGQSNVSPQTRKKVEKAIADLGYRRNVAASMLASGTSPLIGVLIVGDLSYGRAQAYIRLERMQSRKKHFVISASASPASALDLREALEYLQSTNPRALVIISQNLDAVNTLIPHLTQTSVVSINAPVDGAGLGRVEMEQVASTTALLDHLYERGCTRIAHLSPDIDEVDAKVRRSAYLSFCRKHSLAPILIPVDSWSAKAGFRAAHNLPAGSFDAVFGANDYIAYGAAKYFEEHDGLVSGTDYALAGFDDIETSAYIRGGLTTVRQDFRSLASALDTQINDQIAGQEPKTIVIENELVVRGSTLNFSH